MRRGLSTAATPRQVLQPVGAECLELVLLDRDSRLRTFGANHASEDHQLQWSHVVETGRPIHGQLDTLPLRERRLSRELHTPTAHVEHLTKSCLELGLLAAQHFVTDVPFEGNPVKGPS